MKPNTHPTYLHHVGNKQNQHRWLGKTVIGKKRLTLLATRGTGLVVEVGRGGWLAIHWPAYSSEVQVDVHNTEVEVSPSTDGTSTDGHETLHTDVHL